jgi:hypothetical protein
MAALAPMWHLGLDVDVGVIYYDREAEVLSEELIAPVSVRQEKKVNIQVLEWQAEVALADAKVAATGMKEKSTAGPHPSS